MKLRHLLLIGATVPAFALLTGCAAIGTAVAHGNLQTQTLMSKSIFLDPVAQRNKTVYVQVRNTTDKPSFQIQGALSAALEDKGYRVTHHFKRAYYVLQVNLLKMGKYSETAARQMMSQGYGSTLEGAFAGAYISAAAGGDPVAGGLVGAVASTIVDNAVKDVTFTGVADVQITVHSVPQRRFRTRIISTANQVNLKFANAEAPVENGLVNSISGIF